MAAGQGGRARNPPKRRRPTGRNTDLDLLRVLVLLLFVIAADDEDWSYTTKEGDVFTCEHVAEKTKRCTIRYSADGVRADDACKKTCGTC